MPIFRVTDPNVYYDGKILPADKAPLKVPVVDPNVNYDGFTLPAQKVTPTPPKADLTNNPSYVLFQDSGIVLPDDVTISFPSKNIIAQTQILDGVSVFERINRAPVEIEFEFTIRMQAILGISYNNTTAPSGLAGDGIAQNIFPQTYINSIWQNVFAPATVHVIVNTLLNGIGVKEIIIESFTPYTVRGSTNVPCRLRAYENAYGEGLNLTDVSPYSGFV